MNDHTIKSGACALSGAIASNTAHEAQTPEGRRQIMERASAFVAAVRDGRISRSDLERVKAAWAWEVVANAMADT